jgi:hypothetical protein
MRLSWVCPYAEGSLQVLFGCTKERRVLGEVYEDEDEDEDELFLVEVGRAWDGRREGGSHRSYQIGSGTRKLRRKGRNHPPPTMRGSCDAKT